MQALTVDGVSKAFHTHGENGNRPFRRRSRRSVIHAVHSNSMQDMGGLRKYLPITHLTFLIACLAIAGIPPFSGFFSKDEILVAALNHNRILFAMEYLVIL